MVYFPAKKDDTSLSYSSFDASGISDTNVDPMRTALEDATDAARAILDNNGTRKSALMAAKEVIRSNLLASRERSNKSSLGRIVHETKLTKKVNKLARSAVAKAQNEPVRDAEDI
eukprot:4171071-Ditylum_brightwellii.AAC.1